jgi:hypothetical protein
MSRHAIFFYTNKFLIMIAVQKGNFYMATDIEKNRIFGPQTNAPRPARNRAATSLANASSNERAGAPSREQVAKRAYQIWLSRGCEHGHDLEHWIEAERQLRQQN